MRIADSVLLTCWPPAPLARNTSTRRSAGIELDLDVVVDLRRHEHGRERRVPAMSRVERRLADQPVHAGFGAQPAVRVLALHVDRRALDAGDVAGRVLEHVDGEAAPLAPAQVHAQQHLGPVLRLGAAGAGLNVEERVVRVHLAREHAAELEPLELLRHAFDLADDVVERARRRALSRASSWSSPASSSVLLDAVQRARRPPRARRARGPGSVRARRSDQTFGFSSSRFTSSSRSRLRVIVKDTSAERRSAL